MSDACPYCVMVTDHTTDYQACAAPSRRKKGQLWAPTSCEACSVWPPAKEEPIKEKE